MDEEVGAPGGGAASAAVSPTPSADPTGSRALRSVKKRQFRFLDCDCANAPHAHETLIRERGGGAWGRGARRRSVLPPWLVRESKTALKNTLYQQTGRWPECFILGLGTHGR